MLPNLVTPEDKEVILPVNVQGTVDKVFIADKYRFDR
jgi:hypothetical protein